MAAPDPHSLGVPRPQFPRLCPACLPRYSLQTILRQVLATSTPGALPEIARANFRVIRNIVRSRQILRDLYDISNGHIGLSQDADNMLPRELSLASNVFWGDHLHFIASPGFPKSLASANSA